MKRASFLILIMLLSTAGFAQTPATSAPAAPAAPKTAAPAPTAAASPKEVVPTGGSRFAVIDFMTALTQNAEGKKASDKLNAEYAKRQETLQAKQKEGADLQAKLTTDKALTDAQKATMTRQIEQVSTDLTRMNDDYQKEMTDMQQQLLSPIADRVKKELSNYAAEMAFAMVMDTSGQTDNIVYVSPVADITTEIIRRVDATATKNPPAPPKAPIQSPLRPGGTPAPGGAPTRPATPPPAAPKTPPDMSR